MMDNIDRRELENTSVHGKALKTTLKKGIFCYEMSIPAGHEPTQMYLCYRSALPKDYQFVYKEIQKYLFGKKEQVSQLPK